MYTHTQIQWSSDRRDATVEKLWSIAMQLPLVTPVLDASPLNRHGSTHQENAKSDPIIITTSGLGLVIPKNYFQKPFILILIRIPIPSSFS